MVVVFSLQFAVDGVPRRVLGALIPATELTATHMRAELARVAAARKTSATQEAPRLEDDHEEKEEEEEEEEEEGEEEGSKSEEDEFAPMVAAAVAVKGSARKLTVAAMFAAQAAASPAGKAQAVTKGNSKDSAQGNTKGSIQAAPKAVTVVCLDSDDDDFESASRPSKASAPSRTGTSRASLPAAWMKISAATAVSPPSTARLFPRGGTTTAATALTAAPTAAVAAAVAAAPRLVSRTLATVVASVTRAAAPRAAAGGMSRRPAMLASSERG